MKHRCRRYKLHIGARRRAVGECARGHRGHRENYGEDGRGRSGSVALETAAAYVRDHRTRAAAHVSVEGKQSVGVEHTPLKPVVPTRYLSSWDGGVEGTYILGLHARTEALGSTSSWLGGTGTQQRPARHGRRLQSNYPIYADCVVGQSGCQSPTLDGDEVALDEVHDAGQAAWAYMCAATVGCIWRHRLAALNGEQVSVAQLEQFGALRLTVGLRLVATQIELTRREQWRRARAQIIRHIAGVISK